MPAGIRNSSAGFGRASDGKPSRATLSNKIRLGFIVGKAHDPIKVGTQDHTWPERFKIKNNTGPNAPGWGGQFGIDVAVALRVGKLHPDLFEIDMMIGDEIDSSRLAKNHLNFNLAYDMVNAFMDGKVRERKVRRAFEAKASRLWPEWELQDWVYNKATYIRACVKAGIPTIPTICVSEKFDVKKVLCQVQAKGWEKFFIKPSYMGSFGNATWNGKTQDCVDDPSLLNKFLTGDAAKHQDFLVQPYMLKPNGNVFDEVRCFFINGDWGYAVYTDGTDDNAVYAQPEGPMLEQCKELAWRCYREFLKVPKWRGKAAIPVITRIDIGVMPGLKGTTKPGQLKVFLNEFEMEACTLLGRYCPFQLQNVLGEVIVKKVSKLLAGMIAAGDKVPNEKRVKELLATLDGRLGGPGSEVTPTKTTSAAPDRKGPTNAASLAKKRNLHDDVSPTKRLRFSAEASPTA